MRKSKIFDLQTFIQYASKHTASECANYFDAKIATDKTYIDCDCDCDDCCDDKDW